MEANLDKTRRRKKIAIIVTADKTNSCPLSQPEGFGYWRFLSSA